MDERAPRPLPWQGEWPVIGAVAVGGALGATARYAAGLLWPTPEAAFPWTTLVVNVVGCALMGILMVLITEVWTGHRLLRPFLGTGILGGFTTFSTYAVDIGRLAAAGRLPLALAYLAGTLLAALSAVALAGATTRALLGLRRRPA
ncbi:MULTISPECIES: fluoride efflux transporter FluC [Streptomyces]|uniref:fluoride efflux transporter FluC n=1 Tax=Streptomyces TaxID=1883 RepID=UPI0019664213|nr:MULTISPECIES: CrcB family protein [Streptomyces]QRX94233.1 CrcB family protein [Streptomyces noursei]UJB43955.1 CrcB family protein [Streptomyces sp. A1-5]